MSPLSVLALGIASLCTAAPPVADDPLATLRSHYFAAVDAPVHIAAGRAEIARIRERADHDLECTLLAYEGALRTLEAKHGRWPHDRLRALRDGFALLDRAVERRPDEVEIRFLRLMSGFYLPGLFGRSEGVSEDLGALVRLLPRATHRFPAELYRTMVDFVLDEADPSAAERRALEAARPEV